VWYCACWNVVWDGVDNRGPTKMAAATNEIADESNKIADDSHHGLAMCVCVCVCV
jgi:hypothetical protein